VVANPDDPVAGTDVGVRQVLVTRPAEDAEGLRGLITARGLAPLVEPMLEIRDCDPAGLDLASLDPAGLSGLLFTSANGVRALMRTGQILGLDFRAIPAFAVGDATARAARDAGIADVRVAGGDVEALVRLVTDSLDPAATRGLLHPAGSVTAGDLVGQLGDAGFADVRRAVVYEAVARTALSPDAISALQGGMVSAVLIFSPRTAATFVRLIVEAALVRAVETVDALCLSAAVADRLEGLSFRRVLVADRPVQEALLGLLDGVAAGDAQPDAGTAGRDETAPGIRMTASDKDGSGKADPGTAGAEAAGGSATSGQTPATQADAIAAIIERFGGIRPMAKKLGAPVSTVQAWKERSHIPENRLDEIRAAAKQHEIDLVEAELVKAAETTDVDASAEAAKDETAAAEIAAKKEATISTESKGGAANTSQATTSEANTSQASQAAATPPPGAPATVIRKGGGGATAIALLSLVVAGAALTVPYWRPIVEQRLGVTLPLPPAPAAPTPAEPAVDPSALAALQERLDSLGGRVEDLAARSTPAEGGTQAASAADGSLSAEIADLTEKLGDLVGRVEGTDDRLDDRLDSLAGRLDTARTDLETQLGALAGRVDRTSQTMDDRLSSIGDRIEDATQAAERRAAQAAGAVLSADIEALDARLDSLESRADATANIDVQDIEELRGRMTAAETQLRDPGLRTQVASVADSVDALRSRVTSLNDRVDALRQSLDDRPVYDPAAVAALRDADSDLATAAEALRGSVAEIGRKVDIIQSALDAGAGVKAADVAMILGIGQLAQDIRGSAPFAASLAAVEALGTRVFGDALPAPLTDNLAALEPLAGAGVPSVPKLRRSFPVRAMAAARKALVPEDASLMDRTFARLTDLVMVRPTDREGPPESVGQRLARAETLLEAGNLAETVDILGGLEGPAGEEVAGWLADAKARLAAESAVEALVTWATDRLPDLDAPLTPAGLPAAGGSDG